MIANIASEIRVGARKDAGQKKNNRMHYYAFSLALLILLALSGCNVKGKGAVGGGAGAEVAWPVPGTNALLNEPVGIAVLNADELVVVHRGKTPAAPYVPEDVVLILDRATGRVVSSWGKGFFVKTHGLHVDPGGNVWITDIGRHQVFKFTPAGELLLTLGEEGRPGLSDTQFNLPTDVAVAATGNLFVTDGYGNRRIVKFDPAGRLLAEWGREGKADGEFVNPHGVIITPERQQVVVSDRENNRIQVFDTLGRHQRTIDAPAPVYATTGDEQALYATDYLTEGDEVIGSKIDLLDIDANESTTLLTRAANQPATGCRFHDLTADGRGYLYVADLLNHTVARYPSKN